MVEPPQSPLLALPGELRNMIYTCVAHSTSSIRLYKGDLVPPPLANTCRQIRYEMGGKWYTQEIALDHTIPIVAHFTNFDFQPLYKWLATNDNRPAEHKKFLRVLDVQLALVSPSSATPGFPSSTLATGTDFESYGKDSIWTRKSRLETDYQAIISCDSNWVRILDADLLALGCAMYGMDPTARKDNPQLYSPMGGRRRFAETLAGNGYLTSVSTRVEYLHHPRVPTVKKENGNNNIFNTKVNETTAAAAAAATTITTTTTTTIAHAPFVHSADYLTLLSKSVNVNTTCHHAICVRQFRRRIYAGLLKARKTSQKLKWNREYYSNLSDDAKKVVRFYRLLDPLPRAKLNRVAVAFGKSQVVPGGKRKVEDVYALGSGFGSVERGFVDGAWVGCEKRRFGSARGDLPSKVTAVSDDGGDSGNEADVEGSDRDKLVNGVAGLMGRLRLDE